MIWADEMKLVTEMYKLLAALIIFSMAVVQSSGNRPCYSAIYSFGDSLADTGNLIMSGDPSLFTEISELPYGQTFFNNPTGRCSNGRLIVDFFAEAFGFPFLPPYLEKYADFSGGVNFAVAGATALNASFFEANNIGPIWTPLSLDTQITWFKDFRKKYCSGTSYCDAHFGNALFLLGEIGGNDYNYPFAIGRPMNEVAAFVPLVIEKIQGAIQELIGTGAKKFLVQSNLPIGCSPSYLTVQQSSPGDFDDIGCLAKFNNFARYSNHLLHRMLQRVQLNHPAISIVYADYYSAAMEILRHPRRYGIQSNFLRVCCGTGGKYNYTPPLSCNQNVSSCPNPQQHFYWDGIHLTESAYRAIAKMFLDGEFTSPPLNLVDGTCRIRHAE